MPAERTAIRWGVPFLLIGSCVAATVVSLHASGGEIPSFAFDTREAVERLKVELGEFDGTLETIADQLLERVARIETKLRSQETHG
jgi:hypothetical protein